HPGTVSDPLPPGPEHPPADPHGPKRRGDRRAGGLRHRQLLHGAVPPGDGVYPPGVPPAAPAGGERRKTIGILTALTGKCAKRAAAIDLPRRSLLYWTIGKSPPFGADIWKKERTIMGKRTEFLFLSEPDCIAAA